MKTIQQKSHKELLDEMGEILAEMLFRYHDEVIPSDEEE